MPGEPRSGPVVTLAGGVGAARFLRGLVRAVPAEEVVAIVNTGDDRVFYGVHVSPDLDIVTYTLAGCVEAGIGMAALEMLPGFLERGWADAARLAGYIEADRYFA